MTKQQFISYSNDCIRAIRADNSHWALLHLLKLQKKIDRAISRHNNKKDAGILQLDMFKEVGPVTDHQVRIRVIRKYIEFLAQMDRITDTYQEYQNYVLTNWPDIDDITWFDFLQQAHLGLEYYADHIHKLKKTTSQKAA